MLTTDGVSVLVAWEGVNPIPPSPCSSMRTVGNETSSPSFPSSKLPEKSNTTHRKARRLLFAPVYTQQEQAHANPCIILSIQLAGEAPA